MGSRGKLRLSGCDWKLVSLPAQTSQTLSETRAPSRCSPSGGSDHRARYSSFPSQYHDESPVTVELLLRDERRKELSFDFGVRVDRSLKREYERRQRERREFARSTKGGGLFAPNRGQPGDQKSVSPEKPSSSRKLAVSITQPVTQETRKPN